MAPGHSEVETLSPRFLDQMAREHFDFSISGSPSPSLDTEVKARRAAHQTSYSVHATATICCPVARILKLSFSVDSALSSDNMLSAVPWRSRDPPYTVSRHSGMFYSRTCMEDYSM